MLVSFALGKSCLSNEEFMSETTVTANGRSSEKPDWLTTPIEFEEQRGFRVSRNKHAAGRLVGRRRACMGGIGSHPRAIAGTRSAHSGIPGSSGATS